MVYWWGRDLYFNDKKIQTISVVLMNAEYGSSQSFGPRVRSIYIENNTYTGRRSNFYSKPTPIHGPVHKYGLEFSYSISHFSWFPQVVYKVLSVHLSHKFSYSYIMIDTIINGFIPNEIKMYLSIFDHSIITFGIRVLCLGFSKTSRAGSLDRFRKTSVDKVKFYISCCFLDNHSKEEHIKIKYANEFIQNMVLGDPTTCVYQLIFDGNDSNDTKLYNILFCMYCYYTPS